MSLDSSGTLPVLKFPDFSLKDQDGNLLEIKNYLGKKKLVIFFSPQDGSLNCTKEACYFRYTTNNRVIIILHGFNNTFYADKYPEVIILPFKPFLEDQ